MVDDDLKFPDENGLNQWTKPYRDSNRLTTVWNMPKTIDLRESIVKSLKISDELTSNLSGILMANGTIKNAGAVKATLSPGVFNMFKNFDVMSQIKMKDSIISFREMCEKIDFLKSSTIPHMSLYRDILNSIDERTYNWIREEEYTYNPIKEEEERKEEKNIKEDNSSKEDFTIVRPKYLNMAVNINMFITMTEHHIQSSPNVSESEKKIWEKCVSLVLTIIVNCFITWAMGNTPIADSQIVKQFNKVVEIIDNYHYPIEITDIDVNDEP